MLNLLSLAITGGFSSGKSSVCSILQEHGAYVVQCDVIVHMLYDTSQQCKEKIIHLFGKNIVRNGKIDRKRLAEKVFSNTQQLKALEEIVHPQVIARVLNEKQAVEASRSHSLFAVEMPLVFERQMDSIFDKVIFVECSTETAIKRATNRGFSKEEYTRRMDNQLPIHEKKGQADYIIENNGSKKDLESAVLELLKEIA